MESTEKTIINVRTGQKLQTADIKSKKPENIMAMLVKSKQWIYEGDTIEVSAEQGQKILENDLKRLAQEREDFEKEKAAFQAEKAAFQAEKDAATTVVTADEIEAGPGPGPEETAAEAPVAEEVKTPTKKVNK